MVLPKAGKVSQEGDGRLLDLVVGSRSPALHYGMIQLPRAIATWRYRSKPFNATCRIDGKRIQACAEFTLHATREVPDVLAVEESLSKLSQEPTTVEEIALALADRWHCQVEVTGTSDSHGSITCLVLERLCPLHNLSRPL